MANPVLEIDNVVKSFGKKKAVRGVSLNVRPGELYGLIGPNGSGKTTTLRMVTGIYRPTSGSVKVQGFDISESPTAAKMHLGYVPDDPVAYERLTGREFLEFVGELFGMDRKIRDERIDALLEEYALRELSAGLFHEYSRGTRQKITILAALLHDPELLLIDEPMVGLDPASARVTKRLMRKFVDEGGALLLSTHTLQLAEEICDRFGVLSRGKLVAEGTKKDLMRAAGLDSGSLEDVYIALTGEL